MRLTWTKFCFSFNVFFAIFLKRLGQRGLGRLDWGIPNSLEPGFWDQSSREIVGGRQLAYSRWWKPAASEAVMSPLLVQEPLVISCLLSLSCFQLFPKFQQCLRGWSPVFTITLGNWGRAGAQTLDQTTRKIITPSWRNPGSRQQEVPCHDLLMGRPDRWSEARCLLKMKMAARRNRSSFLEREAPGRAWKSHGPFEGKLVLLYLEWWVLTD